MLYTQRSGKGIVDILKYVLYIWYIEIAQEKLVR